jgi:ATP-dependent Clp protease ATP-binding subunit ClpA
MENNGTGNRDTLHLPKKKKRIRKKIPLDPSRFGSEGSAFLSFAEKYYAGQQRIMDYYARVVDRAHSGSLKRRRKPVGSALLLGGPGTGKTSSVYVLARFLYREILEHTSSDSIYAEAFGKDAPMSPLDLNWLIVRVDGQNYPESHRVSEMLGAPPGYVGFSKPPVVTQERLDRPSLILRAIRKRANLTDAKKRHLETLEGKYAELIFEEERLSEALSKAGNDETISQSIDEDMENLQERAVEIAVEMDALIGDFSEDDVVMSIVLIDELHRSHTDFSDLWLRVLDDGVLGIANGEIVRFNNTFLPMTANLGEDEIIRDMRIRSGKEVGIGFIPQKENDSDKADLDLFRHAKDEARGQFGGAFMRRVDKVLYARPLTKPELEKVFEIEMCRIRDNHSGNNGDFPLLIQTSPAVKEFLVTQALRHLEEGAGRLIKGIEKGIEDAIIRLRSSEQIVHGDVIYIEYESKDGLIFSKEPKGKNLIVLNNE